MAIEFHCPHCDKYLKTKDDKAGRSADCPGCGQKIAVPDVSDFQYLDTEDNFGGEIDYGEVEVLESATKSCPMCGAEIKAAAVKCRHCGEEFGPQPGRRGEIKPTIIDVGEVLSTSWQIFKSQMGLSVGAVVVVGVINGVVSQVIEFVSAVIVPEAQNQNQMPLFISVQVIGFLVSFVFQTWLTLGQTLFFLNVARGEEASIGQVFTAGRFLPAALGAGILYGLMVALGFICLIVPGVILALMFGQNQILIIDRDLGVMDSLTQSKEITTGNKLSIFVLGLAGMGIMLLGLLACCVGALFSAGYLALIMVVAYLRMTGQATVM